MTLSLTVRCRAAVTTELRRSVLRPEWPVGTPMPGDDVVGAVHIAVLDDGRPVSAGVLLMNRYPRIPDEVDAWQLRGMATAAEYRGMRLGATVLAAALDEARSEEAAFVWCRARLTAASFYTRFNFMIDSVDYVEPETGLLHRDMIYDFR